MEELFLRDEHSKRRQVEADRLLVDLPLRDLTLGRNEKVIALRIHFGKVLFKIDTDQMEIVFDALPIVDEGVLNHVDQFLFDLFK